MKSEFVALSWAGVFGLAFAGFLLGEAYKDHDIMYVLIATLMVLVVRSDARTGFEGGSYKRGWFAWSKDDDATSQLTSHELGPQGE